MFLSYLIVTSAFLLLSWVLNLVWFKKNHASKITSLGLFGFAYVSAFFLVVFIRNYTYRHLNITPNGNSLDFVGPALIAYIFYLALNKSKAILKNNSLNSNISEKRFQPINLKGIAFNLYEKIRSTKDYLLHLTLLLAALGLLTSYFGKTNLEKCIESGLLAENSEIAEKRKNSTSMWDELNISNETAERREHRIRLQCMRALNLR